MENLKIKVNNEAESKEAQEMFFELGGTLGNGDRHAVLVPSIMGLAVIDGLINFVFNDVVFIDIKQCKEITLPELRALVSLHKNPINMDKVLSEVRSDALGLLEGKEYLNKETYEFVRSSSELNDMWMEIPEGAIKATLCNDFLIFWKDDFLSLSVRNGDTDFTFEEDEDYGFVEYMDINDDAVVIWQRHTHPEELPFVDDEPSLNDQYAEIEQVRKEYKSNHTGSDLPDFLIEDTVNHPSHYASGEIECIDAMEAMLTPEQFIGYLRGNAFKYQWRYENKGGITDLEKAQWYLNKLISRVG